MSAPKLDASRWLNVTFGPRSPNSIAHRLAGAFDTVLLNRIAGTPLGPWSVRPARYSTRLSSPAVAVPSAIPISSRPPGPGGHPASSKRRRVEASATRPTASIFRNLSGEMNAAGSNPRISAAQCDRQSAVSKLVTGAMPQRLDLIASTKAWWPNPKQEMLLMPVIATRSNMKRVRYHAIFHRSTTLASSAALQLLACAALIVAEAQTPKDRFDQLFTRTLAKRQSIHSIRARFAETTTSSLLEKPVVSHGIVIAAPPARVLLTYMGPERRII